MGLDLAEVNADGTHTLPFPTVVIVEAAGTIGWIDVHPDYTTRSEPAQILAALDAALPALNSQPSDITPTEPEEGTTKVLRTPDQRSTGTRNIPSAPTRP